MSHSRTGKLSIIVCTRNRLETLVDCLSSIQKQSCGNCEVVVVPNGCHARTIDFLRSYQGLSNLRIQVEQEAGLSLARNSGAKIATGEWLIYLDDDVLLPEDYLMWVLDIISGSEFQCFGGPYYPIYKTEKPKWLSPSFGHKEWPRSDAGALEQGHLSGGNFIIRRDLLLEVGGFPVNRGMKGGTVGYGEENYVQDSVRELGYEIGFFPHLYLDHWVLAHKYKVSWHLKASFALGKAGWPLVEPRRRIWTLITCLPRSIIATILRHVPKNAYKVLSSSDYYWQNFLIDSTRSILFNLGLLTTFVKEGFDSETRWK